MKNFFIFLSSIIISLFLCEALLRYVIPNDQLKLRVEANKKQFKDFQKLTWNPKTNSFIPLSTGLVNHPEYNYKIKHDEFGFRNPCNLNIKKKIKNIIIGDSFVYGVGVKDGNTLNCQININNFTMGVPNSSHNCYYNLLKEHYSSLEKYNSQKNFNVHILFYFGNDFESLVNSSGGCPMTSINEVNYKPKKIFNKVNYIITKGYLSEFYLPQIPKLLYKSYLNKKFYKNINLSNRKYFLDNGNDTFYTHVNHINQKKLTDSVEIFYNKLKKLDEENLKFYFYIIPSGSDISADRLRRKSKISGFDYKLIDTNLKYTAMLRSCDELDIICYDLRKIFSDKSYYTHDTHLNADGVKTLAKFIEKKINQNGTSF